MSVVTDQQRMDIDQYMEVKDTLLQTARYYQTLFDQTSDIEAREEILQKIRICVRNMEMLYRRIKRAYPELGRE